MSKVVHLSFFAQINKILFVKGLLFVRKPLIVSYLQIYFSIASTPFISGTLEITTCSTPPLIVIEEIEQV